MKKFISLIIAVAIIASMCMMAVPASAATPSITGPGTINTEDGTYSFKVKVAGVPQKNSWIAIFNKEQLKENNNDYNLAGQYGRFFTQACTQSDGSDIKNIVPDGTEVTLSTDKAITKTYETITPGEYVICMFKRFEENHWYELVAQTDLTVKSPWKSFTVSDNTLQKSEAMIHITSPEAYHDTYFTAKGEFEGLSFTAWSDNKGTGLQRWNFEILDTDENVLFQKDTKIIENKLVIMKFNKLPAGDYIFRVSPVDDYEPGDSGDGSAKYYLAMPVSEVLSEYTESCFTIYESCIVNSGGEEENDVTGEDSGYAVAFSLLPVDSDAWDKGTSNEQPQGTTAPDATEAPSDDNNNTEEPGDDNNEEVPGDDTNAEVPGDDNNAEEPGDATAAPEATEAPKATAGTSDKGSADKDGGLGLGAIIGIVSGGVVVLAGAALAIYFLVIKKKK
ncbi:MAG: hypothetical protein E7384_00820 [Ruminococcaceae bacterium]|nr:hypothetical protein [Oscillospiraceae bacterium]